MSNLKFFFLAFFLSVSLCSVLGAEEVVFCSDCSASQPIGILGSTAYNYEAVFTLCADPQGECWDGKRAWVYARLIPEKSRRGSQHIDIGRPDRHWIIEIAPGVTFAQILKRMDDLGCGPGEEHFVHAIERQFIGAKIAHAPYEFRRLKQ